MSKANNPEMLFTINAAIIPINNKTLPSVTASLIVTTPFGIGLSGLSTLSNAASNTSLKTTPPPYKPIVEIHKSIIGKKLICAKLEDTKKPEIAMPASTSDTEVMILAGRINCRKPVVFFNSQRLTNDER